VASETAGVGALAQRYASALFDLALEKRALDGVARDLDELARMLAESPDLLRLVRSPVIARQDQGKAVAALADKAGFADLTRRFLGLLAQNRRLFALLSMIAAFRRRLAQHRNEVSAEVVSAAALRPEQLERLKSALKSAVGQEVTVEARVDASLIGGLIVRVGSRMIDASLRRKLQNLRIAMKGIG